MAAQETLDVDALAAATLGCPAVSRLHPGGTKFVVTYLAGRRVEGVRAEDARVLVSVALRHGASVQALQEQVRDALSPLVEGRKIDVYVADVDTDEIAATAPTEDEA